MTPTIQPAAAGIQWNREFDRLAERVDASVTDREDIPLSPGMAGEALSVATVVSGAAGLWAARLTSATIPAKARDS
jgi:hypothetical protein